MSFLGSGLPTIPRIGYSRVTVDGANIGTPGTVGVLFQVSQEVVQEFQIATVNFDQAMSLSSNGVINIVTRSGGNDYQGSAFAFYGITIWRRIRDCGASPPTRSVPWRSSAPTPGARSGRTGRSSSPVTSVTTSAESYRSSPRRQSSRGSAVSFRRRTSAINSAPEPTSVSTRITPRSDATRT